LKTDPLIPRKEKPFFDKIEKEGEPPAPATRPAAASPEGEKPAKRTKKAKRANK